MRKHVTPGRHERKVGRSVAGAALRTVVVDGHTIAYREAGHGPALVLLHGFLSDSRCWRPQLADLSDAFRVVAWDAPGAGASSDPPSTFTMASFAEILAGFLNAVAIEQAHVLGLSWGGILAQAYYRCCRPRLHSLVLADSYAGWRGSLPEAVWKERLSSCLEDASGPPDDLVSKFLPGLFTDAAPQALRDEAAAIVADFHPAGFRLMALSSAEVDSRDLLPRIAVPTLLLWGEDDRRSPLDVARAFHAAVPGAELVIIPNAGHLSNLEQPRAFNAAVRRFCSAI